MKRYTADFETATWLENETFVWAWAVCEIGNENNITIGNNIDTFIEFCRNEKNPILYFHNEKFDGEFIIHWALTHGFKHVIKNEDIETNTFTTLISDMGQFYSITLYFYKNGHHTKKVTFYDSLKIIPFSVDNIAKSFNLPISKLSIDYNKPRKKNHKLTKIEREYITNDVKIVAMALNVLFSEDLKKMTQGSNALSDYKKIITKAKFLQMFPEIDPILDEDLRKAYRRWLYLFKSYIQRKSCGKRRSTRCK